MADLRERMEYTNSVILRVKSDLDIPSNLAASEVRSLIFLSTILNNQMAIMETLQELKEKS